MNWFAFSFFRGEGCQVVAQVLFCGVCGVRSGVSALWQPLLSVHVESAIWLGDGRRYQPGTAFRGHPETISGTRLSNCIRCVCIAWE